MAPPSPAPGAGDVVASPVVLTGRTWAFEGHVSVRIVEDGFPTPLATGFVTGGGDTLRPFTDSFPLGTVHATHGAVVLTGGGHTDEQPVDGQTPQSKPARAARPRAAGARGGPARLPAVAGADRRTTCRGWRS